MDKRCPQCEVVKAIDEFHIATRRYDGHQGICKKCRALNEKTIKVRSYKKEYREKHKQESAVYQKAYREENKERLKEQKQLYHKTESGRNARKTAMRNYNENHPDKVEARRVFEAAMRAGKFPKAHTQVCVVCNAQAEEWHHHHGYEPEYYFDVIPVCIQCHRQIENR